APATTRTSIPPSSRSSSKPTKARSHRILCFASDSARSSGGWCARRRSDGARRRDRPGSRFQIPSAAADRHPVAASYRCPVSELRAPLRRADLATRTRAVLHRGRAGNTDGLLVDAPGGPIVVKDFAPRGLLARTLLGAWLQRREIR